MQLQGWWSFPLQQCLLWAFPIHINTPQPYQYSILVVYYSFSSPVSSSPNNDKHLQMLFVDKCKISSFTGIVIINHLIIMIKPMLIQLVLEGVRRHFHAVADFQWGSPAFINPFLCQRRETGTSKEIVIPNGDSPYHHIPISSSPYHQTRSVGELCTLTFRYCFF